MLIKTTGSDVRVRFARISWTIHSACAILSGDKIRHFKTAIPPAKK